MRNIVVMKKSSHVRSDTTSLKGGMHTWRAEKYQLNNSNRMFAYSCTLLGHLQLFDEFYQYISQFNSN